MTKEQVFRFLPSHKQGLGSEHGLIVVRNNVSYFRILSGRDNSKIDIMTTTAGEDNSQITACRDRSKLVRSTVRLAWQLNAIPYPKVDRRGREYIQFEPIGIDPFENTDELADALRVFFEKFFRIFDSDMQSVDYHNPDSDLIKIYQTLATDEEGSDVYLSDGVWLSSDGSLHDRGK
ncbi:hypothetical protein LRK24_00550 [Rhodanobacter denitrificans]|uniref:hypothetical protein n=1 Tax=Rhodanobacter denitrificans TaxID=666685 RepID=UPI0012FD7777|nr:hypothetical protein [Rhodanobacter denitrificans]UJM90428.1 hypothetical protein LRK24_00550 [Rhodanobacter denitrificans]